MLAIAGYEMLQLIYESENSYIYQGRHWESQQSVMLKVLKQNYPTAAELTRYQQEYTITQQLDCVGVIRALALEKQAQTLMIVLEDFGGQSLEQIGGDRAWTLPDFFKIALSVTQTLGHIHAAKIIHKDLNPTNILWNRQTDQIKIIDFGISTQFGRENPSLKHPQILEGTLAYLSPEQTGRMNRIVDYRSDFYTLGITFYQLLTGKLPFSTQDPLELIHCHLAKQPLLAHTVNPQVPLPLSQLVSKLMAKTAEDRYQSAWGIAADLQVCLDQFTATGSIAPFPLATKDLSDQFHIPQKLYGRSAEVMNLLSAFERITSGNSREVTNSFPQSDRKHQVLAPGSELMLVAGYSGIGKSSLVQEIYKPVTRSRGCFIAGKFDQFQRNVPYSAIVSAFRELIRQLLAVPQQELEQWQARLQTALGREGQVMIEVIPELEWLIGEQPTVPELPATEAQSRFNQVFQNFMRVFCTPEHPLVMFLDDLQWADAATLKLIHLILTEAEMRPLLLIGAYRDNEVDPSHPFVISIAELRKAGISVNQISLTPLNLEHVSQLIAETLQTELDRVQSLAEFVIKQTGGNPFFVNELLKTLHQESLLTFHLKDGISCLDSSTHPSTHLSIHPSTHPRSEHYPHWHWDMAQITARGITDNVVELMIGKLKLLPPSTQQVLSLAACVGASFDLATLSIICQRSPLEVYADLKVAIQPGLILTKSDLDPQLLVQQYRFGHDRIQEAAYALIEIEQRQSIHLTIGRLLLQNLTPQHLADRLFEIVDHFNLGMAQVTEVPERLTIAQLNLQAAHKAKTAMAYEAALVYSIASFTGVSEATWATEFEWMQELYRTRTDLEFLNGHFDVAQEWIDRSLEQARTELEQADIYIHRMVLYTLKGRYQDALSIGYQVAAILGITVPQGDPTPFIQAGITEITATLAGKNIADLVDLPTMIDPVKILSMKLLAELIPTSYLAQQELFPWVNVMMVQFSLKYGLHPDGFVGFACYGMILASEVAAYRDAYEFGKVALILSQRWNHPLQTCRVCHILSSFLIIWVKPVRESGEIKRMGGKGDLTYAGYNQAEYLANLWFEGQSFAVILAEIQVVELDLRKFTNQYTEAITAAFRFSILDLIGQSQLQIKCDGQTLTEAEFIEYCQTKKLAAGLCTHYILRCIVAYLDGNISIAHDWMRQAEALILTRRATIVVPLFCFYSCLILTESYLDASPIEQSAILAELEQKRQQLQTWTEHCPENFAPLHHLVCAEIARCTEQPLAAQELYDRSIASALEQGFIPIVAVGNERAARFWLGRGKTDFAQIYWQKAHYHYQQWGAQRKIQALEQSHPDLLRSAVTALPSATSPKSTEIALSDRFLSLLDFKTILKASQALSSELILKELLDSLIQILIENAGAQSGYLLLEQALKSRCKLGSETEPELDLKSIHRLVIGASSPAIALQTDPIDLDQAADRLPISLIYYVARTHESVILNNAHVSSLFTADSYLQTRQPKSILCTAILRQNHLIGVLYLENNLTLGAFTRDRLEIVHLLTAQAAISLQNALLYETLEQKVEERTEELYQNNQSLSQALSELQRTQTHLIQSEKMSSLGQMVGGVAHEINNPVNFIHGNLSHAEQYVQDLLSLVALYQADYPQPTVRIANFLVDLELDFLTQDLLNLLRSMRVGSNRIREIVLSLRNFARMDEAEFKAVDVHEGIESTLLLLQHRLNPTDHRGAIAILRDYGCLPQIECYAGQLNQVLLNILTNAIDAIDEMNINEMNINEMNPAVATPQVTIRTAQVNTDWIQIAIADNGVGMPESVQQRIFDPFFTTKPVGKGTGMGMSISYQIITEKHRGKLNCFSTPGAGTEFVIQIPMLQTISSSKLLVDLQ